MGAVFGLIGGVYYWIGKITGYAYPETLGKIHFWIMFIGVNLLAPLNLAWCWNNYFKIFSYTNSNHLNKYIYSWENSRTCIKNENIKDTTLSREDPNSQSAEVCDIKSTASQRINAKELWYIIGLFEANGSLSCFYEKKYIRLDLVIALEEADAKLTHWIKSFIGHGTVKTVKYPSGITKKMSRAPLRKREIKGNFSRYIVRSNEMILNFWFKYFEQYPLLTANKQKCVYWIKESFLYQEIKPKNLVWENFTLCLNQDLNLNINQNQYIKDWLIGFIEGNGSFYFDKKPYNGELRAEFNISQKDKPNSAKCERDAERYLLDQLGDIMGLTGKNRVSIKSNGQCILVTVSLKDIQAVIDFICDSERVKLKGLKKVEFLLWLRELRKNQKYAGLKVPEKY